MHLDGDAQVIHYQVPGDICAICGPEEPDRKGPLRFFVVDTCFSTFAAPPQTMHGCIDFCSLRTGSANCGGRRRTPRVFCPPLSSFLAPPHLFRLYASFFFFVHRIWKSMSARSFVSGINLEGDKNVRLLAFAWHFRA